MPTGYTADVGNGKVTDFRTFALRCARQFGATIMQRDDPMDEPPKHREPSDWNAREHVKALAEVERLASMTTAEAAVWMEEERAAVDAENARYQAMLREVKAWVAPTPDHEAMKKFMADQIESSCSEWVRDFPYQTPAEWLAAKRTKAARDVQYHSTKHAEEIERCAASNAWIDALYASLPVGETHPHRAHRAHTRRASMTEYRVVDNVGVGPVEASYEDAEETAQFWRDRGLKGVRIEQREVGPWRAADTPAPARNL